MRGLTRPARGSSQIAAPEFDQREIGPGLRVGGSLEHQIDKLINLGSLESADYGQDRERVAVGDFAASTVASSRALVISSARGTA